MPMTKCGQCGGECYISEQHKDEGAEAYCSEACASGISLAGGDDGPDPILFGETAPDGFMIPKSPERP